MTEYLKIAGIVLTAALLASVLDKRDNAYRIALGVLACAVVLAGLITSLHPVARLIERLSALAGMESSYLAIVVKTAGIGLLTQLSCSICEDCGQTTLARLSELCGIVMAVCLSLPLLEAVFSLLSEMVEP